MIYLPEGRPTTAVTVNRRWSKSVAAWGRERFPWVVLNTDAKVYVVSSIAFISCYLPCMTNQRSMERWEEAMFVLYKEIAEAQATTSQVVWMGDFNTSSLAERVMTNRRGRAVEVGGPPRDEQERRDDNDWNAFPAHRWDEHLLRAHDMVDLLMAHGLQILSPTTGFEHTYIPWHTCCCKDP